MRVVLLHTVAGLVADFRERIAARGIDAEVLHVLDETLLRDLLDGKPRQRVFARLADQVRLAERAGADLVVVTCSSTSPGVDLARPLTGVPVLKVDDPMARAAVRAGNRIGLVCTATSTLDASTTLLQDHARAEDRKIAIEPVLLPAAYNALHQGDRDTHDRIVTDAALDLGGRVDVLVLAQASLAHLQESLGRTLPVPVLASPGLLVDEIAERVTTR